MWVKTSIFLSENFHFSSYDPKLVRLSQNTGISQPRTGKCGGYVRISNIHELQRE
jgi:hypothetical protein